MAIHDAGESDAAGDSAMNTDKGGLTKQNTLRCRQSPLKEISPAPEAAGVKKSEREGP